MRCLRTSDSGRSAPVVSQLVVAVDFDAGLPEDVETARLPVGLPVEDPLDIRVDSHLRAHHAGGDGHEHYLAGGHGPRLDQSIQLRMEAAAFTRFLAVTAVGQSLGV